MPKSRYRLKGNEKVYILPLGDLHIGIESFNSDYFEYCLGKIDEITSQKRIYLMGDLVESASKKVGNGAYHTNMSVEEQIDTVIDYLKPYKKHIVFSVIGNHEQRMIKDFDHNVMHHIARGLGVPYGYQNIDTFTINGELLRVYTSHGVGSSKYHYTAESKIIRDTQTIDADVVMQGHNHREGHFSIPMRTYDWMKRKHYVMTGAFIRYQGYPDQMSLALLPEAFIQLSVNKEGRMRSNDFHIDEVAPEYLIL